MAKGCKERRAGRGIPRPSGLTQQAAGHMAEAYAFHTGHRFFARLQRCSPLNMPAYPSGLRQADEQTPAARCGKTSEAGP